MTILERPAYVDSIICDKADCPAKITIMGEYLAYAPIIRRTIRNAGWTTWVGRGTRHYCPAHGPKKGHTMRQVD